MGRFGRVARASLMMAAGLAVLALASCSEYEGALPKQMRPLDAKTRSLIERKGMEMNAPILVRLFKEESVLEVWKQEKESGRYAFLKEFAICTWSGVLGPKIKEGDRQAPEGFYTVRPAQMNPNSSYYLSFNMGYPNEFDRSLGRTGSELMVHGACSSRGCYSMTDENIQAVYTLGRLAFQGGQREFQVQAFPFKMTPENMARHRDDPNLPFWLMLKEGYDHFEITGQPPKIDVCERRYIFNSVAADGRSFISTAQCPPMSMPESIRTAVVDKEARDNEQMLQIASRLDRREGRSGAAAIRLALANPTSVDLATSLPMSVAAVPVSLQHDTAPATAENSGPAMTASVASAPAASASVETAQPTAGAIVGSAAAAPLPAARPNQVATAPSPQPAVPPQPVDAGFLPVPELRSGDIEETPPAAAAPTPAAPTPPPDAATLEERMLAGSAAEEASVANSYASASEEEEGLTGMVLKLIKKQQEEGAAQ